MVEMQLLTSPLCCDSSAAGCQDAVPVQTDAQSTFHQCLLRGSNLSTIIQQLSTTISQHLNTLTTLSQISQSNNLGLGQRLWFFCHGSDECFCRAFAALIMSLGG